MPAFTIGQGSSIGVAKLQANGTPLAFTTLNGVQVVNLPVIETDEIEVTHMQSPAGQREFVSGLKDNGSVTVDMLWEPLSATDTLLNSILATGENVHVKFTVPVAFGNANNMTETYQGFLKTYERTSETDTVKTASATFRISAKVA